MIEACVPKLPSKSPGKNSNTCREKQLEDKASKENWTRTMEFLLSRKKGGRMRNVRQSRPETRGEQLFLEDTFK